MTFELLVQRYRVSAALLTISIFIVDNLKGRGVGLLAVFFGVGSLCSGYECAVFRRIR
jgi:hypothetical protein